MPLLHLRTNVALDPLRRQEVTQLLSETLARLTQKDLRWVMVALDTSQPLALGADCSPCAWLKCASVDLPDACRDPLISELTSLVVHEFGIAADRVYIQLESLQGASFGSGGESLRSLRQSEPGETD